MKKVNLFPMGVYRVDPDHEQIFEYIAQEPIKMLGLYAVIKEQREALVSDLQLKEFWVGREKVNPWEGTPQETPRPFPLGALQLWQVEHKEPLFFRELPKLPIPTGLRILAFVYSACSTPAVVALFFLGEVERDIRIDEVGL
jgi:hypothetical protein